MQLMTEAATVEAAKRPRGRPRKDGLTPGSAEARAKGPSPRAPRIKGASAIISPPLRTRKLSELTDKEVAMFATPSGFATLFLGLPLYQKQKEIIDAFIKVGARVTAATANEVGKTRMMICPLVLWHGAVFPRGTAISTSGSWLQVTNQLVPALRSHSHKFPNWDFGAHEIKRKGLPIWTGFSTNDAGRAEGFHGTPDEPLLALADEAKTVSDEVFQSFDDRVNPQRLGLFSSPGYAEGEFYRSHTINRALYTGVFKIAAHECPHISKESIERRIAKWGIDHPLVRSMIFAEFMEMVQDALISATEIEKVWENPPAAQGTERTVFIDWAAGRAENVMARRAGNEVFLHRCWRESNTTAAVGGALAELKDLQRRTGLRPDETWGDADGLGKPQNDALRAMGWNIRDFHGGSEPINSHYRHRIAEVWHEGTMGIKRGKWRIPRDVDLQAQLINRKQWPDIVKGRLGIEPKEELAKRNVESPDRADAILGAMMDFPRSTDPLEMLSDKFSGPQYSEEDMEVDESLLAGIRC